jgi:hypothetical protein
MDQELVILALAVCFAATVAVALGIRLLGPIVMQHFKGAGGWRQISAVYATARPFPAQMWRQQSVVIGRVLYRNCMTVGFDSEGLYLHLGFPLSVLGRRALFVPWPDIKRVEEGRLFWRKAPVLWIGEPPVGTITLPMELFDAIQTGVGAASMGATGNIGYTRNVRARSRWSPGVCDSYTAAQDPR